MRFRDSLGATHDTPPIDPGEVTCFCEFCHQKARERGINRRSRRKDFLSWKNLFAPREAASARSDGYFVQFWRILLRYPELAAWEMLFTDSLRETYAAIYKTVKTAKPAIPVGWHIWHNNSFNPIYRAEQDLQELSKYSDFHQSRDVQQLWRRAHGAVRRQHRLNALRRSYQAELTEFNYDVMDSRRAGYEQIPRTGLSPDYVYRETRRALEGVAGSKTQIWPGIDIDIPTEPDHSKCTAESVKEAVHAAFRAGAPGVMLSRKYSEMRLANLSGAGDAIRELKLSS